MEDSRHSDRNDVAAVDERDPSVRNGDAERALDLAGILRRIHPRTDQPLNVSVAVQKVHEAADLLEALAAGAATDDLAAQELPPRPDDVTPEAWAKLWNAPIMQPGHVYVQHDDEDRTGEWMDGEEVNALVRRLGGWKPEDRWKLDDERPLRATRPDGTTVTFDDYLYEGETVGLGEIPEDSEDRDGRPPYGRVVRFPDGLWIVPNTDEQERERTGRLLAEAARMSGPDPRGSLSGDEAIEILAEHMSPYVGEALAGIKREAPHILDLYRERARAAVTDLLARGYGD